MLGLTALDSGNHQNSDAGTSDATGMSAPVSWLWNLPGPRTGIVRFWSFALVRASMGQFRADVDIGADGTIDASVTGSHQGSIDLSVNAQSGLLVRVTIFSRVQASFPVAPPASELVTHSLSLTYIETGGLTPPAIAPIDGFFLACGGDLFLSDLPTATRHQLTYTARNNSPGAMTWLLLGIQAVGSPPFSIPGTPNCFLEMIPIVVVPGVADGIGDSVWSLAIPGPIQNTTLFAQVAALDSTAFTTSKLCARRSTTDGPTGRERVARDIVSPNRFRGHQGHAEQLVDDLE